MEEAIREEEEFYQPEPSRIYYEPILVCKCLKSDEPSEQVEISARKQKILSTVSRTETYLRERRIPEFIRFLFTKTLSDAPDKPMTYLEKLLNDCMLFRAGHGLPPVLYEDRHLQAVVKSFDPGQRGWLSSGQVRRAYFTLGLTPDEVIDDKNSTEDVLAALKKAQEMELFYLLSAGTEVEKTSEESKTTL